MMEQLGLKVDSDEAKILKEELKKKKQAKLEESTAFEGDAKLTLGDLFSSIGQSKREQDVINTSKLEKQIKAIR